MDLQLDQSKTPERILVIAAHADDIEFGVAGSVAKWVRDGAKVMYVIVTNGAAGSNEVNVNYNELVELRRQEQTAAAQAVGLTADDICFLDYTDGTLEPTLELRRDLTRIIRQFQPQRVVGFDPTTIFVDGNDYINHPDHRATGEATIYAVFPSAESRPIFPELLLEGLEPHHVPELYLTLTMRPNVAVDISEYFEHKVAALRSFKSQFNDDVIEMVRQWAKEGGEKLDITYAEHFRVLRFDRGEPTGEQASAVEAEVAAQAEAEQQA